MSRPSGPGFAEDPTQSASVGDNPTKHRDIHGNYEPKKHGGMKMDGTPDKRVLESHMSKEAKQKLHEGEGGSYETRGE